MIAELGWSPQLVPLERELPQEEEDTPMEDTIMYKAGKMLGRAYRTAKNEVTRAYYLHFTPENVNKARSAVAFGMTTMVVAGGIYNLVMQSPEAAQLVHSSTLHLGNTVHNMADMILDKLHIPHNQQPDNNPGGLFQAAPAQQADAGQNEAWCNAQPNAMTLVSGQNTTVPYMIAQRHGIPVHEVSQADINNFININIGPDQANPVNPTVIMQDGTIATKSGGCYLIPVEHIPPEPAAAPLAPTIEIDPDSTTFVLVEIMKYLWANNKLAAGGLIGGGGLALATLAYITLFEPLNRKYKCHAYRNAVNRAINPADYTRRQGGIPMETQHFGPPPRNYTRRRPMHLERRDQRYGDRLGSGVRFSRGNTGKVRQTEQQYIQINPYSEPACEPEPELVEGPDGWYVWVIGDNYPDGGYWLFVEEYEETRQGYEGDEWDMDY